MSPDAFDLKITARPERAVRENRWLCEWRSGGARCHKRALNIVSWRSAPNAMRTRRLYCAQHTPREEA